MHEQFCMLRIFRLFRINAYYDSLSVITEVIVGKNNSYCLLSFHVYNNFNFQNIVWTFLVRPFSPHNYPLR